MPGTYQITAMEQKDQFTPPCSQIEFIGALTRSTLGSPFDMLPYVCGQQFLTNEESPPSN
jgi:hypothetical protein